MERLGSSLATKSFTPSERVRAGTVECSWRKGKVCGDSVTGDIEVPGSVQGQAGQQILIRAADQRRMDYCIGRGVPFEDIAIQGYVRASCKVGSGRWWESCSVGGATEDQLPVGRQQGGADGC